MNNNQNEVKQKRYKMVLSVSLSNKCLDLRNIPIPFAAFLATLSIWSFQVMHSSTTTPSVLVDKTRLMPSEPIDIGLDQN